MACHKCIDKSVPPAPKPYAHCSECGRDLADYPKKTRSLSQNAAIHKYLELLANEFNKQGVTLQNVVKHIEKAEIRPTGANLKEVMWRTMQIALFNKESSTELTTGEVDKVYEMLNAFLRQIEGYDGTSVPFPSRDTHGLEDLL